MGEGYPECEFDHLERVAGIEWALAWQAGRFLAGNVLHGIAFRRAALARLTIPSWN